MAARNRRSAKNAGTAFEQAVVDYLAAVLDDDRIERRVTRGSKDRGDIAGVRIYDGRVVIECKDTAQVRLWEWLEEAEVERGNDDACLGVVVAHVPGYGVRHMERQLVAMYEDDFEERFAAREEFGVVRAGTFMPSRMKEYVDYSDKVVHVTKRGDEDTAAALMTLRMLAGEIGGGLCFLAEDKYARNGHRKEKKDE